MYKIIRQRRLKLKLTQSELANQASVSLATLQNIEAGHANPSYDTLQALLQALGCQLDIKENDIVWADLIAIGVPLMGVEGDSQVTPHRDYLIKKLRQVAPLIHRVSAQSREGLALRSFLSALSDHYSSVWLECPQTLVKWLSQSKIAPSPKLRRIALDQLSRYL
jgi:transcriptional regulator with XRE-family HTH domain